MSAVKPVNGAVREDGFMFYGHAWRSPESIERRRERNRQYNASEKRRADNDRRVYVGQYYVGLAPTAEQATALTNQAREEFA